MADEKANGYIFFNKKYQEYCIQELGKEPDDVKYLHSIRPYDQIKVLVNDHWIMVSGINGYNEPPEKWKDIDGSKVQYVKM